MVTADDLSDAERRIWDAFPTGRLVAFGTGNAEEDDPADGEDWGPERQVRAEAITPLLCGALEVEPGCVGKIHLQRVRITGKLEVPGGTFKYLLRLDQCYMADGVDLSEATTRTLDLRGCHVGGIYIRGATINGDFFLRGAHLDGKGGRALDAGGLTVTGDMRCDDGFQTSGEINLFGASVGGQLGFRNAHLDGKDGCALIADAITVAQGMFCDMGFQASGEVRLYRASINGVLQLGGAHLDGKDGRALTATGLTVNGDMSCDEELQASGEINLRGGAVSGQLFLSGAHLDGKGGPALDAGGLIVTGNMFCDDGFQTSGEINLFGASVGGQLGFRNAHLDGKGGHALIADAITVAQGMFCDMGFQASGEVRLYRASINGVLQLGGAHLDGKDGRALTATGLTVNGIMFCDEGFQASGEVNLMNAKISSLVDEREGWPDRLELDELIYGDLTYLPARVRLDWLKRSANYAPQPFEQLTGYYRRLGHDEQARRVLLAKQRQRRRQRPWVARWWGWLQDALAGYGYAPGRALLWLTGGFVAGWLVFTARHPAPVGPGPHPAFNAALYSLDVIIPAPALGQASDWDPQGAGLVLAAGLHILGWLLTITVLAAITRSFSRT